MKLALLLPQFAPNLHDLAAMLQADRIIFQDTEVWSRKSRIHRAKIRTPDGTQWINIPVRTEDRDKAINKVRIDHNKDWITPLLRSLKYNYRNSIYFDFYEPEIKADFESAAEYKYLLPFMLYFQKRLLNFLDIKIDCELASGIPEYTPNPDELAQRLGADILLQEHDSRHYQQQAEMKMEPNFTHPGYYQHFDGFETGCCVLDLLFQKGPESFKILEMLNPPAGGQVVKC